VSRPAYPQPSFAHLVRLSDDTGLLEHATGTIPMRQHGYCVDDVARGLIAICREPDPSAALRQLTDRYLAFLIHAQAENGAFHNRLSYQRVWLDRPETGDWWGRAIWGLGTAVARAAAPALRDAAFVAFERAAHQRSRWSRSMAYAGLGAAEVLTVLPGHPGACRILADAVTTVGGPGPSAGWRWPEPRLTYANAALAEVQLAAGEHLEDPRATVAGLDMLGWLLDQETLDGHLSPVPVGGWGPGEVRPGFDQQPIEAAALADACARALRLTGDEGWAEGLRRSIGWFLGENDSKVELADWRTGGGSDGLHESGCSDNQGAESTLALITALQHGGHLKRDHL
jgi:hypothetical protein